MAAGVERLSPVLHLTRIATAFAAVGNVWFTVLWTRALPTETLAAMRVGSTVAELPLWAALLASGVNAVSLYGFAMAVNDAMDVRRDRALHPDRPIASGEVSMPLAVALTSSLLLMAVVSGAVLGLAGVVLTAAGAGAALLFNAAAKHVPSVGLVLVGLIYAVHMLVPNPGLVFLWPVWLAMTHALMVGALTHRLADRRPRLTPLVLALAGAGWLVWTIALAVLAFRRSGPEELLWPGHVSGLSILAPLLLVLAFVVIAISKAKSTDQPHRLAAKIHRYGALWMPLYATGWCAGQRLLDEALILGGLAVAGLVGMTVLREVYSLIEQPVGYRR